MFADVLPNIQASVKAHTRHIPPNDRDDVRQAAVMAAWLRYQSGERSIALLCHCAKQSAIHEKRRTFRQIGTMPDYKTYIRMTMFESELDELDRDDDNHPRPYYEAKVSYEPSHDTAEIRQADRRMDLQTLLHEGFRKLAKDAPHKVEDMKILMADIAMGYSYKEIAERHNWSAGKTDRLCRTMRAVFGDDQYIPPTGHHKPVPDARKQRLLDLVNSGYSIRSAARTIGIGRETARKIVKAAQQ